MAVIEGDGELLLEMGGSQEWGRGGWFYNGGDGKCLKSSYIVGERMLSPLFYADLPISPTTTSPFSNFLDPRGGGGGGGGGGVKFVKNGCNRGMENFY